MFCFEILFIVYVLTCEILKFMLAAQYQYLRLWCGSSLKVESKIQVTGTGAGPTYSSRQVGTAVSRVSRPGRSGSKKQEIKNLRRRAIGLKEGHVHLQLSGAKYLFFSMSLLGFEPSIIHIQMSNLTARPARLDDGEPK